MEYEVRYYYKKECYDNLFNKLKEIKDLIIRVNFMKKQYNIIIL